MIVHHDITTWDRQVLFQTHRWAGHFARMRHHSPTRVCAHVLGYKDHGYLDFMKATIGSQGHGRKIHVWMWEDPFYAFYGPEWATMCLDQERWADSARD